MPICRSAMPRQKLVKFNYHIFRLCSFINIQDLPCLLPFFFAMPRMRGAALTSDSKQCSESLDLCRALSHWLVLPLLLLLHSLPQMHSRPKSLSPHLPQFKLNSNLLLQRPPPPPHQPQPQPQPNRVATASQLQLEASAEVLSLSTCKEQSL